MSPTFRSRRPLDTDLDNCHKFQRMNNRLLISSLPVQSFVSCGLQSIGCFLSATMASVRSTFFSVALLLVSVEWAGAYGRFDVKGRVMCGNKPYAGAVSSSFHLAGQSLLQQMAFYEFDLTDPNDLCDVTTSGKDGTFAAHGIDDETLAADHIVLLMYAPFVFAHHLLVAAVIRASARTPARR